MEGASLHLTIECSSWRSASSSLKPYSGVKWFQGWQSSPLVSPRKSLCITIFSIRYHWHTDPDIHMRPTYAYTYMHPCILVTACTNTWTPTHTQTAHMQACMYVHGVPAHTHNTHIYTHTYTNTHTHTHTHIASMVGVINTVTLIEQGQVTCTMTWECV